MSGLRSWVLGLESFFTEPALPRRAISIESHHIAVASVIRKKGRIVITGAAREPVPPGLIEPRFADINIKDKDRVCDLVKQAMEKAGLLSERRWSLSIPRKATRTFILELDEAPRAKKELVEILQWKVERLLEVPLSELTAAFQLLPPRGGHVRYLVVAGFRDVLASYEAALAPLNIQPGFVVPSHLAETAWLRKDVWAYGRMGEGENVASTSTRPHAHTSRRDALLISAEPDRETQEMSIIFLRGEDFLSIRSVEFTPDSLADEIHRTLVYYLDKLAPPAPLGTSDIRHPTSETNSNNHPPNVSSGDIRAAPGSSEASLETVLLIGEPLSVSDVQASCRALFPGDRLPAVHTLRQVRLEGHSGLTLEAIASAAGLAAMGV